MPQAVWDGAGVDLDRVRPRDKRSTTRRETNDMLALNMNAPLWTLPAVIEAAILAAILYDGYRKRRRRRRARLLRRRLALYTRTRLDG